MERQQLAPIPSDCFMKAITILVNALALGSLALATAAPGDVIYNNLGATLSGADQLLYVGPLYDSFTPTSTETISGLQLALGTVFGPQTGTLVVGLYSSPDNPSADLIATLGTINEATITPDSLNDYTLSLEANPTVTAGNRYWIGLTTISGDIVWPWSSDISGPGVAGGEWAADGGSSVHPNSFEGPYQMDLTGSPAPDMANPAFLLALFGAGLVSVTWKSLPGKSRS
jgi:hypothetical protein